MTTKKNSKLLLVAITLLLIVGIGSIWYVNYQKEVAEPMDEELRKEKLEAEKKLALYVVQNYEDVHKIQFNGITKTKETGFWNTMLTINEKNQILFSLASLNDLSNMSVVTNPKTFSLEEKVKRDSTNLDGIEIIYSGKVD